MRLLLPVTALVVSFWPVWLWCFERAQDKSDDSFGFIAALMSAVFVILQLKTNAGTRFMDRRQAMLVVLCLIGFTATANFLPMLIRAGFACAALTLALSALVFNKRFYLPLGGLLILSLPLVATLQFYLGYPLRLFATTISMAILNCSGAGVHCSGTDLLWQDQIVGIDPACSGIRMLWTGLFLAFSIAALHKLNNRGTLFVTAAAFALVISGNVLRATSLFCLHVISSRLNQPLPQWLHEADGMIIFLLITIGISVFTSFLSKIGTCKLETTAESHLQPDRAPRYACHNVVVAALVVAAAPYLTPANPPAMARTKNIKYQLPQKIENIALKEVPLTPLEARFASDFPGSIHKLSGNNCQVVFRVVNSPTRQLHPAEDCFKGSGYKTRPLPNEHIDEVVWGCFEATNDKVKLKVRERIFDSQGNSWADVSSWYWATLLGKTSGPWQALTIASQNVE